MNHYLVMVFLSVAIITSGCKKDEAAPNSPGTTPITQTTNDTLIVGQFDGNLDGVEIRSVWYAPPTTGSTAAGVTTNRLKTVHTSNPDTTIHEFTSTIFFRTLKESLNVIHKAKVAGVEPDTTEFFNMFPSGSYEYSSSPFYGVEIVLHDTNNVNWSTAYGIADQTNSSYTRTTLFTDSSGKDVFFSAKFNCTLYNKTGQSKTITNGYYLGAFSIMF